MLFAQAKPTASYTGNALIEYGEVVRHREFCEVPSKLSVVADGSQKTAFV